MAATARLNPLLGTGDEGARRHIVTPEGVALPVDLAGRSERAAAFFIDLLIIVGSLLALVLIGVLAGLTGAGRHGFLLTKWIWVGLFLLWFLVRSFYFAFFELRWQGSTPGKRVVRLRVIDRTGGALRADAVIARNLMREVEIFLPVTVIMVGLATDMNGWIELAMLGWILIFTFMPLFNRDRLRVGDIIGGTWVILAPKAALLPDLAASGVTAPAATAAAPLPSPYRFTREQLDAYGIYELQTLEEVLRQQGPNADGVRDEVAQRIQRKIQWTAPTGAPVAAAEFLQAFYAALRARLEAQVLYGRRRKDKHDRTGRPPA
ncbi:MAG TPA: RDD family protein [Methylomirabilota bacterium]|nr:RDD family protein [Methylomirabilota bacterium]